MMSFETAVQRLHNLFKLDKFTDVVFEIFKNGECVKIVKGHRAIFAMASDVFEAMLFGPLAEGNVCKIEDIDPTGFLSLKRYIYTDVIDITSVQHAFGIYNVADMYNFEHLRKSAVEYISANLSPENVFKILEFSSLYDEDESVKAVGVKCTDIIKNDTEAVLNSPDFVNIDLQFLGAIADYDELNVPEVKLFNAIEKWVEVNLDITGDSGGNDNLLLTEVINKVRFLSMTVDEFHDGPGNSSIMTVDERYSLLMNLTKPGSFPLPDRFSKEKAARIKNASPSSPVHHRLPSPSSCQGFTAKNRPVWNVAERYGWYAAVELKVEKLSMMLFNEKQCSRTFHCRRIPFGVYVIVKNDTLKVFLKSGMDLNYILYPRLTYKLYRNRMLIQDAGKSDTVSCGKDYLLLECKNGYRDGDEMLLYVTINL